MARRRRIETELRLSYGRLLAERAASKVRPRIKSRTLREALRVTTNGRTWWIGVPHYWAVYYHDGRPSARPNPPNRFLIWYPNPADDPRTFFGKYPVKRSEINRLDIPYRQLQADIRSGRAVAARVSPRSGSARSDPFFVKGLRAFFFSGGAQRARMFSKLAKSYYPALYKKRRFKLKITPPIVLPL